MVLVLLLRPPRLLLSFHLHQFLIYLALSFHLAPFLGTGNKEMKQPFLRESLHDTYSEKLQNIAVLGFTCIDGDQLLLGLKSLHAKIGELTLENDFLEGALTKAGLLSAKR